MSATRDRGRGVLAVVALGAGMIAIRRRALGSIRFDRRYRGASLGEDVDLSWALRSRGWRLAIATDAHVIHRRAPRPTARHEEAMLTSWGFVYAKHQPKTLANRLAFAWFVTGVMVAAVLASLRSHRLAPLVGAPGCSTFATTTRAAPSSRLPRRRPAPRLSARPAAS